MHEKYELLRSLRVPGTDSTASGRWCLWGPGRPPQELAQAAPGTSVQEANSDGRGRCANGHGGRCVRPAAAAPCILPMCGPSHRSPRVPVSCAPVGSGLVLADVHVCGHDPLASLPSCLGLREPGSPTPWAGPRRHRPASPPLSQETLRRPCSEKVCGPRRPSLRGASDPGWLAVPPAPRPRGSPGAGFPEHLAEFTVVSHRSVHSARDRARWLPSHARTWHSPGFRCGRSPTGQDLVPWSPPYPVPTAAPSAGFAGSIKNPHDAET